MIAIGGLLCCLASAAVAILTSPDRMGSEGPLMAVLVTLAGVLSFGLTDRTWYANTAPKAERD